MMYLACSRLIYAGSEIVPSSLISNSKSLRIRVEIEWGGCSPPFEGWKKPQNIDFSSIFVIGKSKVTFVEVSNKFLDLGYFDLPSDGGWEGGFYVDIPLIPEIRDLVYRNGAKGRLRLDFGGPGIIIGLPDIRQLFASLVFYVPEHSYVLNPKPTNKTDRSIQLEEEIVEEITKIDLVKEGAKEESKKLLQDVRQFLQGGKGTGDQEGTGPVEGIVGSNGKG